MELSFEHESWVVKKWRPAMAWLYMLICGFDFIVAPILSIYLGQPVWVPITLQSAGLIHFVFGGIIGVSAWSRGQEKIAYINTMKDQNPDITLVKREEITR